MLFEWAIFADLFARTITFWWVILPAILLGLVVGLAVGAGVLAAFLADRSVTIGALVAAAVVLACDVVLTWLVGRAFDAFDPSRDVPE